MRLFQLVFLNSIAYPKELLDFTGVTVSSVKKMEATGKCLATEERDAFDYAWVRQNWWFSV